MQSPITILQFAREGISQSMERRNIIIGGQNNIIIGEGCGDM